MSLLKKKLADQIPGLREDIRNLIKTHGGKVISEVTVQQAYGGMRGVKGMVCDTSVVEPDKGLIIRGIPVLELTDKLPEEIFWLLLTGELPSAEELKSLQDDLRQRYEVPGYVWDVLRAMPKDSHPMTMLDTGILVLQHESEFARRYSEMAKTEYWDAALEDALRIIGMIPGIAAGVYRIRYDKGDLIAPDNSLDWAANYVHMLGLEETEDCYDMMRLYLLLHSDHEGGNVSANVGRIVNSALSDPYYSLTAALNGLAGPLHGLANQECLKYVQSIEEKFNGVPSEDELKEYVWATLNSGRVIPGYGHAVLRTTDPRFTALLNFGKRVCPYDNAFRIVEMLFKVVPGILKEHGKAKNPWPNVDAASGSLLYHFGMTRFDFYTVMFGASRILGISAQMIMNRGLFLPIFRPKSVTFDWLKQEISKPSGSKK